MANGSTPAPAGGGTEPTSFEPSSATQKVWREGIEIFKLRERLSKANSDQSRFDLLTDLIDNLLPVALSMPEPPADDPHATDFPADLQRMKSIDASMNSPATDAPVPNTPFVKPHSADYPRTIYQISLKTDTPSSLAMREEVGMIMDKLMENEQRQAAHRAVRVMRGYYREIRTFLAKYPNVRGERWDLGTSFSTELTAFGQDDIDRAGAQFSALEQQGERRRPDEDDEDEEDEDHEP